MARYELLIKPSALRELEGVGSRKDRRRIVRRITDLGADPRPPGCEKLSGQPRYRVRQGDYRVLYEVDDERRLVTVTKVGHRREVYRRR